MAENAHASRTYAGPDLRTTRQQGISRGVQHMAAERLQWEGIHQVRLPNK